MTLEMWQALVILAIAISLFITEWLRVDIVAIIVVVALMVTGLVTTQEALSGFSNTAVLTIAALFVVGGGVLQTGLAGLIGRRILLVAGNNETRLLGVIMLTVALLSAFMSDTGTVAVLLPAIISLARSARISPGKLLIPLSYGALLGGAMTLIGTPPNIIVSDLLRREGLPPFTFFDYTPIGLILLVVGISFMTLLGHLLLPGREEKYHLQRIENPKEMVARYRLPDNLFRLRVRHGSKLIGQSITASGLRRDFNLTVIHILRPPTPRSMVRFGEQRLVLQSDALQLVIPTEDTAISLDDILVVQGTGDDVGHAAAFWNLGVQPAEAEDEQTLITQEAGLAEVLLPPRSALIGKTLTELRFGTLYRLTVLGIKRPGVDEPLNLKETRLRFGDSLLLQGPWQHIQALKQNRQDFVVIGEPESLIGLRSRRKAPLALLILVGMLVLMVTNTVPVVTASMLAGLVMVLTGCLSMDDAYQAVDWKSIVLIAGMIPMSIALEKVGVVNLTAQGLTNSLGSIGPLAVLAGLFLLTSAFTQVLSNTATAVLLAPIALASARTLDVQPFAFLMAVAIAASMAFASPVASPVNTLVMGAGNYRFSDYLKVGLPLTLLMLVVAVLALPILWPL